MSEELLNTPEQVEEIAQNVENVAENVEQAAPAAEAQAEELPAEPKAPKGPRKMREIENPYANALENFSWDKVSEQNDRYSKDEQSRLEEAYSKSFKSIEQGDVITGKVVSINDREVVLNIGFKSDGVINASELRYNKDLKIGDEVEVYVESQEDANGQMQLSHKRALILKSWQRVNEAYDKQEVITGYVKGKTKGGLIVDVFGIEAFLPGSQIDVKQIRDFDVYVGKTMEFKVVKINHDYKNVVVSHKALIEAEIEAQKAEIISRLEVGQILEGTVKNIVSYGAFVDLGGLDGLIHITDLSWGRISHPSEVVQLDQKVNVVILNFEEGKKRIALGLKQLTPQPWEKLDPNLKVGDKVKGKVVVITDYGAFVEVIPGVEGLIHVSEMSWSQHLRTAHDFLKVGDEIEAVVLTLDREGQKMSLGLKQLIPDPWAGILEKYPVGSRHTATVRNFTTFGIFVELEEGVDGLIHISDLSWNKKIKHPAEFTKVGESIDVVVLEVDTENRRLSLGHKQLEENPWDVYETIFTIGSVHEGTITGMNDKGATVLLPHNIEGFAFNRHLLKADKSTAKEGETLPFMVVDFSKDAKKIHLSHTKTWQPDRDSEERVRNEEERQKERDIQKVNESNVEKATLGDLNVLQSLKEDLEKEGR
jgi:small subunit ribosomal protein S1